MLHMKETTDNMEELSEIGVTLCDQYRKPTGNVGLSRGSSMKIKRSTSVTLTSDRNFSAYELNLFSCDFAFVAESNLTGSEIYDICEQLYSECE